MFERFVIGKRRNWKRRALIVGSLVAHGGAVAALVVASWFHVAELTPPLLAITFVTPAPPEAAPQPKPPAAAHHTQRKLSSVTQPPTTPQPTPTSEPPAWSGSDEPGPPDGPPDGPAVGRPGGGGPPCSGAGCIAAPAPRPRNLPPHALDAQRIAGAMPHLPPSVLGSHRGLGDATFTARLCVDTS
ncbi:MAG TPA: hypothetical protein VGL86_09980, partial [Polyangia bacterium]